jgi:aminomethyltransferase
MQTSPVQAALMWTISKRRRAAGGFPGAAAIMKEFAAKPARMRSGLVFDGKRPARHGAKVLDASGAEIGVVTSGSFSPNLNKCACVAPACGALLTPPASCFLLLPDASPWRT